MNVFLAALILILTAILAHFGTRVVMPMLKARAIMDHPNERSSHQTPTPRGGGIAVIVVVLVAWIAIGTSWDKDPFIVWGISLLAIGLAAISWIDDLKGLGPLVRLVVQAAAVTIVLALMPDHGPFFQGLLPPLTDRIAAGVLWVWFINLYNFMDGIDGITGVETFSIGTGLAVIIFTGGAQEDQVMGFYGIAAAGAALGFLKMNWSPAKIFMGDVGSVPLGFLLGWLLLSLAASGQWAAAVILPSYYLSDATLTLCRRAVRGEKIWRPHRLHFYQVAVQRGLGHGTVSLLVLSINATLVLFAMMALSGQAMTALAGAALVNIVFLFRLARGSSGDIKS